MQLKMANLKTDLKIKEKTLEILNKKKVLPVPKEQDDDSSSDSES